MARKTARRTARRTARPRRMRGGGERKLGFRYSINVKKHTGMANTDKGETAKDIYKIGNEDMRADAEVGLEQAITAHLIANRYTGVGPNSINFGDKTVIATFDDATGDPGVPAGLLNVAATVNDTDVQAGVRFSEAPTGGRKTRKRR